MIINVYKPKGLTSFNVVSRIRKILNVNKVGHAGTLDPLAEGVLIVLTDKDTKKQNENMHLQKEYIAEVGFGIFTETYDMEFLPKYTKEMDLELINSKITQILEEFIGKQSQSVPAYSAVKVDGKRLYKMARNGNVPVELPIKEIEIYGIKTLEIGTKSVVTESGAKIIPVIKIQIRCSSGTYIRSLARDIGLKFGVDAVMMSLVRTKIGDFDIADSVTLDKIDSN